MFKPNRTTLQQHSFFSPDQLLPRKYQERLRSSWSHTFRHEVFARIDESIFAVLYSEEASRPNAPMNVVVCSEILKAAFNWSDMELRDAMTFDLQVRHALGLEDLAMEVPELRTIYNWRRRVREYAEVTGTNLFQEVYAQVTGEQLEALEIKTSWQRVDSTQILSNLAQGSRLELVISVVQKLWRAMPESSQSQWEAEAKPYISARPYQICYRIKSGETHAHLWTLGKLLVAWAEKPDLFKEKERRLLERLLREQFAVTMVDGQQCVRVRSDSEIKADSLQSAHDEEATYRVKNGKTYRGGFVANVSETCGPTNQLQLITDIQVAPNVTDDARLLEKSLESQAERGIEVEAVTADGGYTGPVAEEACEEHDVELRATNMRGGVSRSGKFGWESYDWKLDEHRTPISVRCPEGQEAPLEVARGKNRYVARYTQATCEGCPFFNNGCRVTLRGSHPSIYVTERNIRTAMQRRQLRPEDHPVRAVVEATVRSVKHPFRGGKLPVRGLIRVTMMICASALMVNLRRIHEFRLESAKSGLLGPVISLLQALWRRITALRPTSKSTLRIGPQKEVAI